MEGQNCGLGNAHRSYFDLLQHMFPSSLSYDEEETSSDWMDSEKERTREFVARR